MTFPKAERFRLTDQLQRSSRSVCANLGEAYGRRNYPRHYRAKVHDCIAENYETQVWLDIALAQGYLTQDHYEQYIRAAEGVGKLLSYMLNHQEQFIPKGITRPDKQTG
ncbi:four helix bundle protein [Lewinella marina]|nr:four helix bundle protein [Neolewinella marina]